MKVSVVIPVYNKAPYLRECLDSVFAQTFTDFEVIAVDDRSTDDGLEVLRSYTDPRLQVLVQEQNGGPAAAVRTAMDRAQGEYIIRMDADDVALLDRFAAQVEFMDAHPEIGISGSRVVELNDPTAERSVLLDADALLAESFFTVPVFQPTAIYRRSVLLEHGLAFQPDWPRIGEDWLFYVHAGRHTRFGNIDRALVRYRVGEQNISHGQDMQERWKAVLRVGLPVLGLEPTDENIRYHLMTKPTFLAPVDRALVRGFKHWIDRVVEIQRQRGLYPQAAFEARMERSWDRLFHFLPEHSAGAALEHMRLSKHWPKDRLLYLLKVRTNALLGRSAKP